MAIRTYKVTLDSKNTLAPEPVYLRQGDKTGAVVIDATLMDNGAPISIDGLTPMFKANTADGQAVIADSTGFNIVNASGGEFTYQVPNALSSVPGKITTAYFSFSDSSGSESTFDVAFIIKKAVDITQAKADDYITIIDGTLDLLHDKMQSLQIDLNTILNNYNTGNFYNKSETDSKDAVTLSSAKTYTDNSLKGVSSVPETFTNLAAIKAKYPSGKNGLMVAADNGHKYIWANGTWTDAGVYQSVGIADRSIEPEKLTEATQNSGLTSGVFYPLTKGNIINNALPNPTSTIDHLSIPLNITIDNADANKTYLLLQIFNNAEKNLYGATFGYAPKNNNHTINANDVIAYNFDEFSNIPPLQDQYGHVVQKYEFDDDTVITITYQAVNALDKASRLTFGDINGKKYYDSCIIDESCYRYRLDSRGLNRNLNVDYPLVNFKVPDNGLKNSEPLPAHRRVLRDVKVINPDPDLSYLIAGIYNDNEFNRYGVQFAAAKRIDGNSFNKESIEVINKLDTLPTAPISPDDEGNVTFSREYKNTILTATYNLTELESPRLLYFSGNNYYDIALINEASHIALPIDFGSKKYKRPTWLGDSITEINSKATIHYHEIIADKWNVSTSTNMGISGSTIGDKSNPMSVRYKDIPADTDFISVFGGVNDYGKNQPLGKYGDTTNDTFYGALYVLLNGLQTQFPTIPKIFISPMHIGSEFGGTFTSTVNGLGLTQDVYEKAIVEMTRKFSVPHLSLFSDMGVTFAVKQQSDYYSADSLHPNNAGHEIIADKILKFLK